MHILQVTLGFYPALAWGGPIRVVHQNARELVRRGHQVTVYCTNLLDKKNKIRPGTFQAELDGMRIVYFNTWKISWWPGVLGPIWLPDLPAYLRREITGFDVVHLNGYRCPMMLQAAKAARKAAVPIVTQPLGTLPIVSNSHWVKLFYDRLFGRGELDGISALIALQDTERRQALAHGIPEDRIEMIPIGIVPIAQEAPAEPGDFRRRFHLDPDRPLILFLGRINKIKGTDMLIEAFARLENVDAQLAIVGPDDGQLAEVESLVQRYDLDGRVHITGLIPESDKVAAFQDADLFVLPSRYDAYPTTIMEACLACTPMVITDGCQSASLVRDRVADVVPFDANAFAAAMRELLNNRERYDRYQGNCRKMVADHFSIGAVVDRLEALYERVIAARS